MLKVKELREQRGLSQKALAEATGVSQQQISAMETGFRPTPGVDIIYALAKGLGCEMSDLYVPDDEKEATT